MRVAGQSCICANRIFVQESIAAHFIPAFIDRVRAIKVGDGLQPGVEVGPLINEATLHKVESLVQDAVAKGAQVAVGGQRLRTKELSKGWFYAPTVLQATPHRPGGALADAQSPAAYQSDPP